MGKNQGAGEGMKRLSMHGMLLVAFALAGCEGTDYAKMSPEEAISYQATQLLATTTMLFASRPSIPDGDLTKWIVLAGEPTSLR